MYVCAYKHTEKQTIREREAEGTCGLKAVLVFE